ncbi:MAG: hypothetical protein AAF988_04265 [Pseudomonadota bacterium]
MTQQIKQQYEVVVRPKFQGFWSSAVSTVMAEFYNEDMLGLSFQVGCQICEEGEAVICTGNFRDASSAALSLREANHFDGFFNYNLDQFRIGLRQVGKTEMHLEMLDCQL